MTDPLPDPVTPTDPHGRSVPSDDRASDAPSTADALDPRADASWLRRRASRLLGARVRRSLDTQDVIQHVELEAWRRRGTNRFDSPSALRGWLGRVAANFVRKEGRRQQAEGADSVLLGALPAREDSPSQRATSREQAEHIRERLAALPERSRQVVELRLWEGLDHDAIAERLGITPGNARVVLHRALKALEPEIEA